MKLTTIILITTLLQVSAASFGQKVTLVKNNVSISQVFNEIRKQTGYGVVAAASVLRTSEKINVNFKEASLATVIDFLLKDKDLSYTIEDKTVVIEKKEISLIDKVTARFQAIDVRGRVLDENGAPIAGATVRIKASGRTVITDKDGIFHIKQGDENSTITISYIGYQTKEVEAGEGLINIHLELANSKLDEVQVIAYGKTSQRLNVGNITSIKAIDIEKQPVNNPLLALQGHIPGLQIMQANGIAGGGVKVQIQGQNSILYGNDPFYVIDGVPYLSQLLSNIGGILGSSSTGGPYAATGSPLSLINPSDIESIEVLKDASATAIYGSRAANGAILITTKKGKAGKTQVDFNLQSGVGKVAKKLDMLDTQEYLEMRREAYKNDGVDIPNSSTPQDGSNYDLTIWDQNKFTDWQKKLIGGTSNYDDAQVSVSGGNALTQFLLGSGYHRETTVFPGDFADKKGSVHFNLNNVSENQKFRLSFSGNYLLDNNKLFQSDLTLAAVTLPPNAPDLRNPDGTLNWARDENGNPSYLNMNPLSKTNNKYEVTSYNLTSNANLSYEVIKGLQIKSSLGYTSLLSDEKLFELPSSNPPEYSELFPRKANYGKNTSRTWIAEPQIYYTTQLFTGQFSALIGTTFQRGESHRQLLVATGFSNDLSLDNIGSATSVSVPGGSTIETIYKYNALFGRLNYNWQDKYVVDLTVRRDGSSRFGSQNQLHNFGAIGAAWLFSNETFIKDKVGVLSFGKLKASYGTSGNDQIGDYSFLSLYDPNNPPVPYRGGSVLQPRNISNPYLQWEETRKLNAGMDLGFFKDRILFTANYSYNRSSNQLLLTSLPTTTGPASISTNLPATLQNTGLELSLNTINVNSNNLTWSTNLNITIPRNKVVAFYDLEASIFYKNQYLVGQPVNVLRLYNYAGVNALTGLYEFIDKNGQKISTDPATDMENRTILIDPNQKFYGGLSNTIKYKGFHLDLLFTFAKQQGITYKYGSFPAGFFMVNQPTSTLDRWQNEGDENKLNQRYSATNYDILSQSDYLLGTQALYGDASYIRLKNASFSWELPDYWLYKGKLKRCVLFVHGQNLLTITNYQGLDPETLSSFTLPPLRVITFGTKITL